MGMPETAMVLAAGLGKRMRPLTATMPKPLVEVGGRALIDHASTGWRRPASRTRRGQCPLSRRPDRGAPARPQRRRRSSSPTSATRCSRPAAASSGAAAPRRRPFFVLNSDSFWLEGARPNSRGSPAAGTMRGWTPAAARLDVGRSAIPAAAISSSTRRPARAPPRSATIAPFVYAGAAILQPRLFADAPDGPFSLNLLFDRAIAAGRLFGVRLDGTWINVGDARPRSSRDRGDRGKRRVSAMDRPHVFTIPPGAPFLDTLVGALLDGRLIEISGARPVRARRHHDLPADPPRRPRHPRELSEHACGRPLLLPEIRTLGDFDEDEASLLDLDARRSPAAPCRRWSGSSC